MSLTKVELKNFTAFSNLALELSPGLNILIGENGTGKTHLMKVCYAACAISTEKGRSFADKLLNIFLPSGRLLGRLVKRQVGRAKGAVTVYRGDQQLKVAFSNLIKQPSSAQETGTARWAASPIESVYIPVKEMLANAPGFLSLYRTREIHFEEIYRDIVERAYLPVLRGPTDSQRRELLANLQKAMQGKVRTDKEEFFLKNRQGRLEFSLLAEGMRKLGLLWLLIQNGSLGEGSVLFWDEPETNLNPSLFGPLMEILLELQQAGVQIFLATHDYVILKEIDLRRKEGDTIAFHSLYRNGQGEITCQPTDDHLSIDPNAIAATFTDLYDREIKRNLAGRESISSL